MARARDVRAAALDALKEHGAVSGVFPEHYRNIWTWLPEDVRPPTPERLLPLLQHEDFGSDPNGIYFWARAGVD